MKIVVTCAHAGLLDCLLARGDFLGRGLYQQREQRRNELHESLDLLSRHAGGRATVHVLECYSRWKPRHLTARRDCRVYRARTRVPTLSKGVREFLNLDSFLRRVGWPQDEMVCKITGRYLLLQPGFLDDCLTSAHDVIVRKDSDIWGEKGRGVHTFLFGARVKVILNFVEWLKAEDRISALGKGPVEWPFSEYLTGCGADVWFYPRRLDVRTRFARPLSHPRRHASDSKAGES